MIHENMNISHLVVHAKHVKREEITGRAEMLKGQDLLMEVLQIIGLRYKTSLDLKSGFLIKFLPSPLRIVVIW